MAAIPTILKGDTPAAITIALAEGFDYAESTLHVRYMGVEKVFTGLVGGGSISLQFTEEETSRFPVGAAQVVMWLVHPGGRIRTIPTDNVRIKVTDSASEVYNAQITLRPATLPPDATDADTLGDLKAKYNALKATLAAGCAALCVLVSSAAGISGGNLNDIPGNAMVVTNVTFEGLATIDDLKGAGVSPETVTNIVKAVASHPEDYTTTNAVKDIVTNDVVCGFSDWEISGEDYDSNKSYNIEFHTLENHPETAWPNVWKMEVSGYNDGFYYSGSSNPDAIDLSGVWTSDYGFDDDLRLSVVRKVVRSNALGLARLSDLPPLTNGLARTSDIPSTAADVGAASKDDLGEIWNYMMAENFRVTVSNYDSTVHAPVSYYEFRMSTNEPWRVVWTETNGLARTHTAATNDAFKAAKAEIAKPENRAWGRYDATTGAPAPEGIVQVSSEGGLMIGGGMGYTSVAASGGEYWVLTATDPTLCRTGTNGVFEIIDSSGNAAFTVRKGDKRLVPAPVDGISATADEITIVYLIESAEHPEIECSATLDGGGTWFTPGADGAPFGAATWSGGSGEWVATIPRSVSTMGFFRASYYTGGGTVVSYGEAAIYMPKIKIGNVEYTVGTATISGHTVLTLEARP